MRIEALMLEQEAMSGFTHRFTIEYTDLTAIASTGGTLQLLNTLPARTYIAAAAMELETAFAGTSMTALTCKVGYDLLAGTDDDDAFIVATELLSSSKLLAADGNGAAFATLRTGYCSQEQLDLEAVFTATGANLTALTAGKVHIYLKVIPLIKLR